MNQRGFATLEIILMVMVIGILASVAVPRFTAVTAKANTAKIQSDLSTLDTAISIYYMENGKYPDKISDLKDYVKDIDELKPPTGKAYVDGTETEITVTDYTLKEDTNTKEKRAALGDNFSGKFSVTKKKNS